METQESPDPWKLLQAHIESGQADTVQDFLDELPSAETARAISRLSSDETCALLQILAPENAAEMLMELPAEQAADLLEETSADTAAAIVEHLPASEQADILAEVGEEEAEAILDSMDQEDATLARLLLEYPKHTAGGIMDTDFLAYRQFMTVGEVVEDLRANREIYTDYEVQYAYVVTKRGELVGVLRMRDLLMTEPGKPLREIMIARPLSVPAMATLDELQEFHREHPAFLGVPAVDDDGKLVGVVRMSAVMEATRDDANSTFLSISGIVGGEEFRSMPLMQRSLRRLSWLAPNIVLNIIAASVIAVYQDTLQAVIALAVFLPIISDMSGCSGNQAVAVSIRELSLGLIRPNEYVRVVAKEGLLGVMNGVVLGTLLGLVAFLWQGNIYLGLVVGAALSLNTLNSVLLGGLVPLALRRCNVDPALASGPILTTVTDMCGFLLVLGLASLALAKLTV
jgi:magnesium transporter